MLVRLNGEEKKISAASLSEAMEEFGYGDAVVATAVNGTFVPAASRENHSLKEGDAIEVIAPMQGG